jgi:peroxiredoxin
VNRRTRRAALRLAVPGLLLLACAPAPAGPAGPAGAEARASEPKAAARLKELIERRIEDDEQRAGWLSDLEAAARDYLSRFPGGEKMPLASSLFTRVLAEKDRLGEAESFALEQLRKARSPDAAVMSLVVLNQVVDKTGKPETPLAAVAAAMRQAPSLLATDRARLFHGDLLLAAGRAREAATVLEQVAATGVEDWIWRRRAASLTNAYRELAAAATARDATAANRRKALAQAESLIAASRKDAASGERSAHAFLDAAQILLLMGERDKALAYYQELASLHPRSQEASIASLLETGARMVGTKAPPVEGPDLDGGRVSLSRFAGNVVLLDFWFTTCQPCLPEIPHLVDLSRSLRGRPFALVSVSVDVPGRTEAVRQFVARHGMAWTHVYEGLGWRGEIVKKYQVMSTPMTFVIDAEGTIRHVGLRGLEMKAAVMEQVARAERAPAGASGAAPPPSSP